MGGVDPAHAAEILADVRDGFNHLEAAVSAGQPELARSFVGPELYEELIGTVRDLAARRRRRVHGEFEILGAEIITPSASTSAAEDVTVRLHAISSLAILDRAGRLVDGSEDIMRWSQELTAHPDQKGRWLITGLGQMTLEGPLIGPAGAPLEVPELTEREKRERDSEEYIGALLVAGRNFLVGPF